MSLWTAADDGFDPQNPFRNRLARYALPSVDEWHKAAYFEPVTRSYLKYPTGSDFPPIAVSGSTVAGTAVYGQSYVTGPADVGMAGGLSPFGMMAAGGNVFEWEETEFDGVNNSGLSTRGVRGGDWTSSAFHLAAPTRLLDFGPSFESDEIGFRVAMVPESTLSRHAVVVAWLAVRMWRRNF